MAMSDPFFKVNGFGCLEIVNQVNMIKTMVVNY